MMTVVCSFLFPMGLQGVLFVSSARAAWGLTLGNLYALVLKLASTTSSSAPLKRISPPF